MDFTVGKLEEMLRQFPKGTVIHSDCGNCHHGSSTDIKINDKTNQTYGYIELVLNGRDNPRIECSSNEYEFYEKEIERLKNRVDNLSKRLNIYNEMKTAIDKNLKFYSRIAEDQNV